LSQLIAADSVDIHVLVDNATDMLSSVPSFVETETAGLARRGVRILASRCLCCAAHGFACLVTVRRGSESRTFLFDTGPEDYAFERNVTRLGADLGAVEAIMLSHGHWDHAGAMLLALTMIRGRNGGKSVPWYGHPGMFRTRGVKQAGGWVRPWEDIPTPEDLASFGAEVVLAREPQYPLGGLFYVSGEIKRQTPFERGYPGQVCKTDDGGWEPDEVMPDERFLAVNVAGKGLIVFSACSHAGIVNVCKHAREQFPDVPLHAIMGGLHLSGPNEAVIPDTVEGLREFRLPVIAAGHCTGWRALTALTNAFGDKVVAPTAVGKRYSF
jgi:7,8-dihydropterin-6-yl-methyl-4-(beta-D-ribofuranosyl)aminobenzene 5'-phosphate synthase